MGAGGVGYSVLVLFTWQLQALGYQEVPNSASTRSQWQRAHSQSGLGPPAVPQAGPCPGCLPLPVERSVLLQIEPLFTGTRSLCLQLTFESLGEG